MTHQELKVLIEVKALEMEVQGMMAQNAINLAQGGVPCYHQGDFVFFAEKLRELSESVE